MPKVLCDVPVEDLKFIKDFKPDLLSKMKSGILERAFNYVRQGFVLPKEFVPGRPGKWINKISPNCGYECSECGQGFSVSSFSEELVISRMEFCPFCGIRLYGVVKDESL